MKLHLENALGEFRISSYADGVIIVNEQPFTEAIIVTATEAPQSWGVSDASMVTIESLAPLLECKPEVILVGTGERQVFPDMQVISHLYERQIGVEIMDTRAACRTFNIVAGEGRRVVAGLMPLG